jgi:hypothetical protein
MKTFVSSVAIISAFACWAYSGCASSDTAPAGAARAAPQSSPRAHTLNLPQQFAKTWQIDECEGVPPYDTGLLLKDLIEIEESGTSFKVKVDLPVGRNPDPNLLRKADLKLFGQQDAASQNVLSDVESKALCAADTEDFEQVFWNVLVAHKFELAYLAGVAALHKPHSDEEVVMIFLPYVFAVGQPTQFIMAVIPVVPHAHDEPQLSALSSQQLVEILKKKKKKKNHNGIVHGSP